MKNYFPLIALSFIIWLSYLKFRHHNQQICNKCLHKLYKTNDICFVACVHEMQRTFAAPHNVIFYRVFKSPCYNPYFSHFCWRNVRLCDFIENVACVLNGSTAVLQQESQLAIFLRRYY